MEGIRQGRGGESLQNDGRKEPGRQGAESERRGEERHSKNGVETQ